MDANPVSFQKGGNYKFSRRENFTLILLLDSKTPHHFSRRENLGRFARAPRKKTCPLKLIPYFTSLRGLG